MLLVNIHSRLGTSSLAQIRDILKEGGLELVDCRAYKRPRDLVRAAHAQIEAGIPLVIIGGGDGTFSAVAHLFSQKDVVMGVLPLGTGNAFARDLGIPANIEAACDTILKGKTTSVDMGLVGDRAFVNVATIGLTTQIALGLGHAHKKLLGRAAYVFSLLRGLATVKPFHVRMELPNGVHEFESLQVVIGNGRFHAGPFPVAVDASITGGWLSVYALASSRKGDLLKLALKMLSGMHLKMEEVQSFRVQSGKLTTQAIQRITVDGEICLKTPVDFGIVPQALKVIVPQSFEEGP